MRRTTSFGTPLSPEQRAALVARISAANEEMRVAKVAAFDAYARVHPVGHARCSDRCDDAKRELDDQLRDINAAYQAALPRMD